MQYDDASLLPDNPAELKAIILSQSKAYADLQKSHAEIQAKLDKTITELQRLSNLFEKFFNKSSQKLLQEKEKRDAEKQETAQTPENAEPEKPKGKRGEKGGGGRNPLPPDLPRVEKIVEHEVPKCDFCGTEFKCIGDERSEQLHFKPMELFVVVQVLLKYVAACQCSEKRSETVESPIKADDKGVASNSLIAAVAVQKYMDHLPVSRQSKQLFRRAGVHLPESSMCRWMGIAATICFPLYDLMHRLLYGGVYVQMDATGVKYLDPEIKGKAGQGTIWGYNGDITAPYVIYDFQTNGTRAGPALFLKGYDKFVQCDANTVNHGLFLPEGAAPPVVPAREVGCWSHCRSNFYDAKKYAQPESLEILAMIGSLYGVERRGKKLTSDDRLTLRKEESVPKLDAIFDWCRANKDQFDLPTDVLGKAIRYALNQEAVLRVYCTDGRLEIGTTTRRSGYCEAVFRRYSAIGRKNWQFYGSANGGKTGAILHSILASAHRHGLNEYEYLLDVIDTLTDLPSKAAIYDLLPDRWQPKSAR